MMAQAVSNDAARRGQVAGFASALAACGVKAAQIVEAVACHAVLD
jgi:hypothetical protein